MVSVWGKDKPLHTITVVGSWNESIFTQTDTEGKWRAKIKTPEASGPFTLTIKGSDEVVLKNILIGEVRICSGQSNMEMPIKGFKEKPVNGSMETIASSANPNIRLFTVNRKPSLSPEDDVSVSWLVASPETVKNFQRCCILLWKEKKMKQPMYLSGL